MKDVTRYTAFLIILVSHCFSCEDCCNNCVDSKCRFANIIAAHAGCYDAQQGLILYASGNAADLSHQTWTVYVLKDSTDGWTPNDIKINEYRNGTITIPDSILLGNQQVFAELTTWCNGTDYHSMGYHFFKMTSNNCTTWVRQEKPPHLYYCFESAELLDAHRQQHEDNNVELQYGFQKKSCLHSYIQTRYFNYSRM